MSKLEVAECYWSKDIKWYIARAEYIVNCIGKVNIQGKTVADLGSGNGILAEHMQAAGAIVTAFDAREENIEYISSKGINAKQLNLNFDLPPGPFDIVLSVGLIYHLKSPKQHLIDCCKLASEILVLESVVAPDSEEELIVDIVSDAAHPSVAYIYPTRDKGQTTECTPTPAYLENLLHQEMARGVTSVELLASETIDYPPHIYSWTLSRGTEVVHHRMWLCKKGTERWI